MENESCAFFHIGEDTGNAGLFIGGGLTCCGRFDGFPGNDEGE
jgi:hypothetical protein